MRGRTVAARAARRWVNWPAERTVVIAVGIGAGSIVSLAAEQGYLGAPAGAVIVLLPFLLAALTGVAKTTTA
jgi:hypothetical protein